MYHVLLCLLHTRYLPAFIILQKGYVAGSFAKPDHANSLASTSVMFWVIRKPDHIQTWSDCVCVMQILPVPSFNIINGGSHAGNALAMQVTTFLVAYLVTSLHTPSYELLSIPTSV